MTAVTDPLLTRRSVLQLGFGTAAAGLLAACGSSSSSSSGKPAASSSNKSLPSKVRVGTIAPYIEINVMQKQGFLNKALGPGVDVSFHPLLSAVPMANAVAGGSLDIGHSATPTSAIAAGDPIKIIATFEHNVSGEGLLVKPNSGITTISDLKGKKIGAPTAVPSVQLYNSLKSVGLSLSDVTLVSLEANVGVAGLIRGAVDAYSAFDPYYTQAILQHQAQNLNLGATYIKSYNVITANAGFLSKYPEAAKRFLQAMKESIAWIHANPSETVALYAQVNKLTPTLAKEILPHRVRVLQVPNADFIHQSQQDSTFQYKQGLTKHNVDWSTTIQPALVKEVLA